MTRLLALLLLFCPLLQVAAGEGACAARVPRNLFSERLGKSQSEVRAKLDQAWAHFFEGNEKQRVYYPVAGDMAYIADIGSGDVRSEGMSYGMMIAVMLDKPREFDRLWRWVQTYMLHREGPRRGYFAWQCRFDGTHIDPGSASDGEAWFAMALLFAAHRWNHPEYQDDAQSILDAMLNNDRGGEITAIFDKTHRQIVFAPTKGASRFTDPSYHLPHFFTLWAAWDREPSNRRFWSEATEASRAFLRSAAHPQTGLMSEYAEFDGRPRPGDRGDFRYDAWRILANVAMDQAWFAADPWQVEQSNRVLRFLKSRLDQPGDLFTLDGKPLSEDKSIGLTAMAAVAGHAAEPSLAQPFLERLWNAEAPTGRWRYYNGLLYFLALLQCSGEFKVHPPAALPAEDGYRLWLRYEPVTEVSLRNEYQQALGKIVFETEKGLETDTLRVAREELQAGLRSLLGKAPQVAVVRKSPAPSTGEDGFSLYWNEATGNSGRSLHLQATSEVGVLYAVYEVLRKIQTRQPLTRFAGTSAPLIQRRILNHWDNLNRTVERGYAGFSLWEWFVLPEHKSPRYRDYARACASVGINGTVLTNVNADALILTPDWLEKVVSLAEVFRPYGLRVYLTARFSAPIELGGLPTADPLDPRVKDWWKTKVEEIYRRIPDFGGFLVKANSEGQPGPQNYGRSHAEGANCLAEALAPHGGIVLWRAFVYETIPGEDRAKQAYNEFAPLDGSFLSNVVVQIKNGAIDFMPREPFHPLFGAMPKTALALELQITQEYLGQGTQLCYLAPLFKECLDSDTHADGPGTTVARLIDGSRNPGRLSVIAGVANTGDDRNWTGHPLSAANWYAFGRLAWNHTLGAEQIAEEWTRMTFSNDKQLVSPLVAMLLESREAVVNYSMPLGLHHIMAEGHHYGPGPWFDQGRADWTSVYYHRADETGLGFNRTRTGSRATEQYHPELARLFDDVQSCPEPYLLWFHHLPWDHTLKSGNTLWDELCFRYQSGVDSVRTWRRTWAGLEGRIDAERHSHVAALLGIQEKEAVRWRDACLLYFQLFSKRPLPAGVEPSQLSLEEHKRHQLRFAPGNPSGK